MKIKINSEIKKQLFRYVFISIFGYGFVFASLYLMVNILNVNKSFSFMIVYGVSYLLLYSLQLKFLFQTEHNKYKLLKFCFSLLFFYLLANIIYNLCIHFEINYLISTATTIILLFPLRFIVSKYFVYK